MRTLLIFPAVLSLVCALPAPAAEDVVNPHYSDNRCDSCHVSPPTRGSDGKIDYNFRGEDIDPTCNRCHEKSCCTIGSKDHSHASGVDTWDQEKYGAPEKLPLQDGYITCSTCHYYIRSANPNPRDYKLVRLVSFSETTKTGADFTDLCEDCHKDF